MGIYYEAGIYGIKVLFQNSKDDDFIIEISNQERKLTKEEIDEVIQKINSLSDPFRIYQLKKYFSTYDPVGELDFMWVRMGFSDLLKLSC